MHLSRHLRNLCSIIKRKNTFIYQTYRSRWEGNNYRFKRERTRSNLDPILRIKNRIPNSDPTRISRIRDLTMKTEGNVGRGIILGKAAARVYAVRTNSAYVYTCMYVSGGHGFWPRYGCAPAFFLCHDHVHVLAFNGIRPHVSIDRSISRSTAAFGLTWLSKFNDRKTANTFVGKKTVYTNRRNG